GGELCGSRGAGLALVGFAVRLRDAGDEFECEYRGAFRSGKSVGPVTNGAPCRSSSADDYLEGIQLTIVRRRSAVPLKVAEASIAVGREIGPRFSVFREDAHQ